MWWVYSGMRLATPALYELTIEVFVIFMALSTRKSVLIVHGGGYDGMRLL